KMPNGDLFENRSIELVDGPGSMTVTATWAATASPKIRRACDAVVDSITMRGPQNSEGIDQAVVAGSAGAAEFGSTAQPGTTLAKEENVALLIGFLILGGIIETAAMVGIGWILRRRHLIARNLTAALVSG